MKWMMSVGVPALYVQTDCNVRCHHLPRPCLTQKDDNQISRHSTCQDRRKRAPSALCRLGYTSVFVCMYTSVCAYMPLSLKTTRAVRFLNSRPRTAGRNDPILVCGCVLSPCGLERHVQLYAVPIHTRLHVSVLVSGLGGGYCWPAIPFTISS